MKTTTLQPLPNKKGRLKNTQQGMTLLEVLIAMFVLSIGILALLSVQLRSVSGVREAEGQTIVSQITQNLIESMMINPVLSPEIKSNEETGRVAKNYDHYLTTNKKSSGAKSKDDLAAAQIAEFNNALAAALPETQVFTAICHDSAAKNPTYNGKFNDECDNNGNDTVIKVLWLADSEEKQDADGTSSNKKTKTLTTSGQYIVYTYQSRVTE